MDRQQQAEALSARLRDALGATTQKPGAIPAVESVRHLQAVQPSVVPDELVERLSMMVKGAVSDAMGSVQQDHAERLLSATERAAVAAEQSASAAMIVAQETRSDIRFRRGVTVGETMRSMDVKPHRRWPLAAALLLLTFGTAVVGVFEAEQHGFFKHKSDTTQDQTAGAASANLPNSGLEPSISAPPSVRTLPSVDTLPPAEQGKDLLSSVSGQAESSVSLRANGVGPAVEELEDGTFRDSASTKFQWNIITVSPDRSQYEIALSIPSSGGLEADEQVKKRLNDGKISDDELIKFLQENSIIDPAAAAKYGLYVKIVGMNTHENKLREVVK